MPKLFSDPRKAKFSEIRRRVATVIATATLICCSGCISAASVGHSGKRLVDFSHKADALQSAYVLPDGNIVVFVAGRLSKREGKADFSLLIPKAALLKIKEERKAAYASESGDRTLFSYHASIGPSSGHKLEVWTLLKSDVEKRPITDRANFNDYIPPQNSPVIYALDRAPGASNEKGLKELWGNVQLVYVDTYPDGTVFRCEIKPKAERIEKTHNGLLWLPVTVPLDVVTMPAQALWGALFVIASAGEASGNR